MSDASSTNLLSDPIIATQLTKTLTDVTYLTLPEVLAAYRRGAVEDFPYLCAFREHAWHALLVQLAALATVNAGAADSPADSET